MFKEKRFVFKEKPGKKSEVDDIFASDYEDFEFGAGKEKKETKEISEKEFKKRYNAVKKVWNNMADENDIINKTIPAYKRKVEKIRLEKERIINKKNKEQNFGYNENGEPTEPDEDTKLKKELITRNPDKEYNNLMNKIQRKLIKNSTYLIQIEIKDGDTYNFKAADNPMIREIEDFDTRLEIANSSVKEMQTFNEELYRDIDALNATEEYAKLEKLL